MRSSNGASAEPHEPEVIRSNGHRLQLITWAEAGGQASIGRFRDDNGREFALKRYSVELRQGEEQQKADYEKVCKTAMAEWKVLERIGRRFPLCAVVRGVDHSPGSGPQDPPWLLLEWIDGKNLRDVLTVENSNPTIWRDHPLEWRLRVARAVIRGVTVLHQCAVIWRDVHLKNIKLANPHDPDSVYLLDFGIARSPEQGTKTISIADLKGCLGFTPFERLERKQPSASVEPRREDLTTLAEELRGDVWATAAVLHAVLFAALPFDDEIPAATHVDVVDPREYVQRAWALWDRASSQPDLSANLPPSSRRYSGAVRVAMSCALRVRPEGRFRNCVEFERALLPALEEMIHAERLNTLITAHREALDARIDLVERRLSEEIREARREISRTEDAITARIADGEKRLEGALNAAVGSMTATIAARAAEQRGRLDAMERRADALQSGERELRGSLAQIEKTQREATAAIQKKTDESAAQWGRFQQQFRSDVNSQSGLISTRIDGLSREIGRVEAKLGAELKKLVRGTDESAESADARLRALSEELAQSLLEVHERHATASSAQRARLDRAEDALRSLTGWVRGTAEAQHALLSARLKLPVVPALEPALEPDSPKGTTIADEPSTPPVEPSVQYAAPSAPPSTQLAAPMGTRRSEPPPAMLPPAREVLEPPTAPSAPLVVPTLAESRMTVCFMCSKRNPPEFTYCIGCGVGLGAKHRQGPPPPQNTLPRPSDSGPPAPPSLPPPKPGVLSTPPRISLPPPPPPQARRPLAPARERVSTQPVIWIPPPISGTASPPWGDVAREGVDQVGRYLDVTIKGVRFRMRFIGPGRFTMGSPASEEGRDSDEIQHEVEITKGFWLADTPTTQALWEAVMGSNPSAFKGADRPVENVSWEEVEIFHSKLNALVSAPATGPLFRFPHEAEWEYSCRAGTKTATWAGEMTIRGRNDAPVLDPIAWYGAEAGTQPVMKKLANPWGLYDMLGNVWEWCSDWFGPYATASEMGFNARVVSKDSLGPPTGTYRVFRGGAWSSGARVCRAACRFARWPGLRYGDLGFRLAGGQVESTLKQGSAERK